MRAEPLTKVLAEFVVNSKFEAIPLLAIERAKMSLMSTLASAVAGYKIPSSSMIRTLEVASGGSAEALVWYHGARLPVANAARVNAIASDASASDDSDLRSIAHIGTAISAAGMAVGECLSRTGKDILTAMVLGYEIAGRIDESLTPGRMQRGFHGTVSTIFGSAVAAGKLYELDVDRMAHAIALAATSACGMAIAADTSCSREYGAGNATMLGIHAARAAQAGFQGELHVLEATRGFLSAMKGEDIQAIHQDLGGEWDIVTDMAVKLMPGAHPFHALAEAAIEATTAGNIAPADIKRIVVRGGFQWTAFRGEPHPRNLIEAAHSLYYFIALSVVERQFGWDALDRSKMLDPVVATVQNKIEFDPIPPILPDRFPHHHGGQVSIILNDGRQFSATRMKPKGSHSGGIQWDDVDKKFCELMSLNGRNIDDVERCVAVLHTFELQDDVTKLLECLINI